ncbi:MULTISPECIES: type I restriction-modification system subunit M/S [unclassified Pseudofrankia]|uniref:type I restriction-modification system subunit M/S n=1 Tax=unclassified Pseudofrankia TaxID=2994372 RepID=UPI0008DB0C46|nr:MULTISPECIES: type I restriction-modification system subunit M/S [unclassified Pseudofrankia]MDT3440056.1 N-6 DNA methylase [Pseudofrankia sp. BMG5.37]OHV44681.1 hypothetical protein BCD48_24625 [Pseudofrankia sp. BMG5.36]
MPTEEKRVSAADIARLAGVKLSAVSNWRRRHPDFPSAIVENGRETFAGIEVSAWLDRRKIAAGDLRPNEKHGMTYGDRFQRRIPTPTPVDTVASQSQSLWRPLDHLRGLGVRRALPLVLTMLWIRFYAPEAWADVRLSALVNGDLNRALERCLRIDEQALSESRRLFDPVHDAGEARALQQVIGAVDRIDPGDMSGNAAFVRLLTDEIITRFAATEGRAGDTLTPNFLVDLVMRLTDPTRDEKIYDPFCRLGEFLTGAAAYIRSTDGGNEAVHPTLCGFASNLDVLTLSRLRLRLHGLPIGELRLAGAPAESNDRRLFDVITTNPPFNVRNWAYEDLVGDEGWPYGPPPSSNANFAWIQHAVARLAPGGRAAIIMANNAASSEHGIEKAIRSSLVEDGAIDALISLPGKLFFSTSIPIMIWILRRAEKNTGEDILFVDASGIGKMVDRTHKKLDENDIRLVSKIFHDRSTASSGSTASRLVPIQEIREKNYNLNPGRYATRTTNKVDIKSTIDSAERLHRDILDQITESNRIRDHANRTMVAVKELVHAPREPGQQARLGDVCDVLAGPSGAALRRTGPRGGVPVIKPKNIGENRLVLDGVDHVDADGAEQLSRYRLLANDIVCTRTGELGRQALITDNQAGWLFGTSCIRLRPTPVLSAHYLLYYIGHPATRDWILRHSGGSAIPTLTTSTLRELPIRVPSRATQDAVEDLLGTLDREIALHHKIERSATSLRDTLLPLVVPVAQDHLSPAD